MSADLRGRANVRIYPHSVVSNSTSLSPFIALNEQRSRPVMPGLAAFFWCPIQAGARELSNNRFPDMP